MSYTFQGGSCYRVQYGRNQLDDETSTQAAAAEDDLAAVEEELEADAQEASLAEATAVDVDECLLVA
eukprot:tig00020510_g9831.t1